MISFKNIKSILNEKLVLRKKTSPEGKTIFTMISDLPDRKSASNETFKNQIFIKNLGFSKWNKLERRWETDPLDETQANDFVKNTIKKLNEFNKEESSDTAVTELQGENLEDRFNKFVELLKSGIMNVKNSKEYQDYVQFQKRFRKYSFNNTLLIFLQKRNATHVAGLKDWNTKFNRLIKKGEKGIVIWRPAGSSKYKKRHEDDDVKLGEDPLKKIPYGTKPNFVLTTVYDISQTEPMPGKEQKIPEEIQWYDDSPLDDRMRIIFDAVKQYANENNIKIDIKTQDDLGGARGVSKGGTIELISENLSTLIHEVAHEMLHWKDRDNVPERKIRELQAEGVANFVLSEYDIPAPHTEKYLALWQIDPEHINSNFNVIKDTSKTLIEYINNYVEQKGANL
ncbi:MAG: hypothetical protein EBU90_25325 [Proteobacteria bacterium]|nr:hypothetical protein [Pseudomonadota bacterium]